MSDDAVYPSRLKRASQGPVRGMGSGFAANQAVAGAADPEAAARMAAMDPTEARELVEQAERKNARLNDLRAELWTDVQDNGQPRPWTDNPAVTMQWLAEQPPGDVEVMHSKMLKARDEAAEGADEDHLRETLMDSMGISPDDPLYDPILDKERKRAIEGTLEPLDFEKMVFDGYVDQEISLRGGKFKLVYRTVATQHGLWMERMLMNLGDVSVQYGRHWFSLLQVAISLQTVNGKAIGGSLSNFWKEEQYKDFRTAVDERMKFLGRLPGPLTDDLIVQYTWFVGRVRKLLAGNLAEKVGNS